MTNFVNNQCLSNLIQGPTSEAVVQLCFVKKVFLEINKPPVTFLLHGVHPPLSAGEVEPPTKFSQRRDLKDLNF